MQNDFLSFLSLFSVLYFISLVLFPPFVRQKRVKQNYGVLCVSSDSSNLFLFHLGDPWNNKDGSPFLKMSKQEKRALYKCGDHYETLESVPLWPLLYKFDKYKIIHRLPRKGPGNLVLNVFYVIVRIGTFLSEVNFVFYTFLQST